MLTNFHNPAFATAEYSLGSSAISFKWRTDGDIEIIDIATSFQKTHHVKAQEILSIKIVEGQFNNMVPRKENEKQNLAKNK